MTNGHIGFTGTQKGMTPNQLSVVRFYLDPEKYLWFHHGDCIGADAQAHQAARRKGLKVYLHPPDNSSKRAFCYFDKQDDLYPYIDRNKNIVLCSDLMLAAPGEMAEQLRSGTWATIRYARRTKTPLIIVYPDGSSSTS